jgi:WD40 repeat protein
MMKPPSRADQRPLVDRFGREVALDVPLNGLAWLGTGSGLRLLVAAGDGILRVYDPALALQTKDKVHGGAILAFESARSGDRVFTGGDDGRLVSSTGLGGSELITEAKGRWIDQVASGPAGALAWSEGRQAIVMTDGARTALAHPSTVGGLDFDETGGRLAAAHYGGASIWTLADPSKPNILGWKGSHVGARFAPGGKFLVTIMQENALHGWRLAGGGNMRMSGYPTKPKSLSFSSNGLWLATSGAEGVVLWPFKGKDGPMGKNGELVAPRPSIVTAVAFSPIGELLAVGYSDGCVVIARRGDVPMIAVRRPKSGPIEAVAWADGGRHIAFGTADGTIGAVDLKRAQG